MKESSRNGSIRAAQYVARASGTPNMIHDRFGGRSAIRFDASDGADSFRIELADNPTSEATDFSVAVVFATDQTAEGNDQPWFRNTGLVDANTQAFGYGWGIAITSTGQVTAGMDDGLGRPPTTITTDLANVTDGQLHTVLLTREANSLRLYVDQQLSAHSDTASTAARSRVDLTFGDLQTGGMPFSGDIAEIRIYASALNALEAEELHSEFIAYYDNARPVAIDDQYDFVEDENLIFVSAASGVLANDTDAEGDRLTAELAQPPERGVFALNPDGSFVYAPPADDFGTDSFTYWARDSQQSNLATVTLTVENTYDPAVAVPDLYRLLPTRTLLVEAAEGLLANDENPDRTTLTTILDTNVSQGQLTLEADGSFHYDPQGFSGTSEFTYRIHDGVSLSAPARVELIANTRPIAMPDAYRVSEDLALDIAAVDGLLRNDLDADADALHVELVQTPQQGALTLQEDGAFRYEPAEDFFGQDEFQYRVSDDDAISEVATVTLTVEAVNDAPIVQPDLYFTGLGQALVIDRARGVLANDTDIENDPMTVVLERGPEHGKLQLDVHGSFHYVPDDGFRGTDLFSYQAQDVGTRSVTTQVTLYVGISPIVISEVMAANITTMETRVRAAVDDSFSGARETPDWIELRNTSGAAFDAGGFFLSDDRGNAMLWQIPTGTIIPADGYAVLFASGKNLTNPALDELGIPHTNFSLNMQDDSLSLAFPNGQVAQSMELGPQYADTSFLLADALPNYFTQATPGAANSGSFEAVVAPIQFDQERGFYSDSFELELSTGTADAVIYYTLDGTAPAIDHGERYQNPIAIETTTTVRAAAFRDGHLSPGVQTHSYLFLESVINQPASRSDYPTSWAGMPADYGMDPDVVGEDNLFDDRYRNTVLQDLQALPTLSLVFDPEDLFGQRGIYQNPLGTGDAWERSTSVEYFDPARGETGFHVNSGIRVMGGSSRQPDIPKHSFRLEFREQYGVGQLEYPLYEGVPFGEGVADRFDELVVRVGFNNSWMHRHYYQGFRGEQPRDQWVRDLQFAMGQHSAHGRFVHVYLNGMYWGIYNVQERPAAPFLEEYFGGDKDTDWDVINSGSAIDGNTAAWNQALRDSSRVRTQEEYEAFQQQVDVLNLADYMLLNFYIGNTDWDGHNWIAAKQKPNEPFRFYAWDSEFAISLPPSNTAVGEDAERQITNTNRTAQSSSNGPSRIHQQLTRNEEYRMLFADRVHQHFFNGGVLTPEVATRLFLDRAAEIDRAVVAESARWGDFRRDVNPGKWRTDQFDLFTRDEHYLPQQEFIVDRYLPVRTDIVLEQLRRRNLYPDVAGPQLSQHGGRVSPGFSLSIAAEQGTIYFTLDGTDPRQIGGAVAEGARQYADSVVLTENVTVKARALWDGEWSALTEASFRVAELASIDNIRISEVHYHPSDPTLTEEEAGFDDADDFEFIEFVNIGDRPIDLRRVALVQQDTGQTTQGVQFDFSDGNVTQLQSGQRVVVVEDLDAFRFRYGPEPLVAGQWSGRLDNRTEQVTLAIAGGIVHQFTYRDDWFPSTDGRGHSLVSVNPGDPDLTAWSQPDGWRSSFTPGGSPASGDTLPGDANHDGLFDSTDVVLVMQSGEYEDEILNNSTFEEGDWDGDGDFTTNDWVFAFQWGGYSVNARAVSLFEDFDHRHRKQTAEQLRADQIDAAIAVEHRNEEEVL